ncbi:replicative DNA helicase [Candidatus Dojkabacteria bacterium]|jgi:replicative DNA helicase|nr:replicative DNA helicase [Candidatus Dojkabacteria bacterium]
MTKLPPQSIEAEQSVLGAMLLDKDAVINVAGWLYPEHFYDQKHAIIYENIIELFEAGQPIDIVTLTDKLKGKKALSKIGGRAYLTDLVSMVPTAAHAGEYGELVRGSAVRRGLIKSASSITELACDEGKSLKDVVDNSEKLIFDVAQVGVKTNFVHIKDLLKEAYERAEKAEKEETYLGISSGFRDIDSLVGGFQKSDLIIIAARPSVGKSSFALDIAKNAALVDKKKVVVFSLEMSKEQIISRFLSMQSGIPFWDTRMGRMTDEMFAKYATAMGELAEGQIYVDDTPGQHINEIRTKARRLALEKGVDLIVVDYLQLIHGSSREGRTQEVSEISQGLKNIAREVNVPVIALSQLNRSIESRTSRRPQLSDLRDSGSIEQDADIVMFIDREDTYNPDSSKKGTADIIVAKHRNGPTGDVQLAFIKELASFRNLYKEKEARKSDK